MSVLKYRAPSISELRDEVQQFFGVYPCDFQVEDAMAQIQRKDCITIAATGSGKTLTFWMSLLFVEEGMFFLITALNILGDQNVAELKRLGISAINLTAESTTDEVFRVSFAPMHLTLTTYPIIRTSLT
jgi:superfamily II DNA helicase RecQ